MKKIHYIILAVIVSVWSFIFFAVISLFGFDEGWSALKKFLFVLDTFLFLFLPLSGAMKWYDYVQNRELRIAQRHADKIKEQVEKIKKGQPV